MNRYEFQATVYKLCQEYGRTTDHTDELIKELEASIVADE